MFGNIYFELRGFLDKINVFNYAFGTSLTIQKGKIMHIDSGEIHQSRACIRKRLFSAHGDFAKQFPSALLLLGFNSERDTHVCSMQVVNAQSPTGVCFYPQEGKFKSCVFGDLVRYYGFKTLAEVKDFARYFFTDAIYNAEHGGFVSALFFSSELTIKFSDCTITYT